MCGRFGLSVPQDIESRFEANPLRGYDSGPVLEPRHNIAPGQEVLTIAVSRDGDRVIKPMVWGLTPSWWAGDPKKPQPINVRSETVLERTGFRSLLAKRRCLIPADGFWKGIRGQRQPWSISLNDGQLYGFAGIWDATPQNNGWRITCAILTTAPNSLVADIHDRMPVIVEEKDERQWLDQGVTDPEFLASCLRPYPSELMRAVPVVPLVNDVRNEGPNLRQEAVALQPALLRDASQALEAADI